MTPPSRTNSGATLLALDQGTTSSRAILFSATGRIIGTRQRELKLHYPQNGWVEQDASDIWRDTLWAACGVLRDHPDAAEKLAGIGIANQRETTILWDRKTGKPVHNAIVWQDRRTADLCARLKKAGHEATVRRKTGLRLDPYFSATKIAWLLDNVKGLRRRAEAGDIAFGTVDSWLLWQLTGGPNGKQAHKTDATNASRTLLFNIRTQAWDMELLRLFNIPAAVLPTVEDNVAKFGQTAPRLLGRSYTIGGMAGDQHAALLGQGCVAPGMVKATYGTGCFVLQNIGPKFKMSKHQLLTTPAWRLNGETTYAIEGSIFVAGAAVQWLRDGLRIIGQAADCDRLATSVRDSGGVVFVPAFTGLGAPYWNPAARGAISGLTRDTTAAHIARAALEAQAFQTLDLMQAMQADTGHAPPLVRADGGLTASRFTCQFIADMLGMPVEVPRVSETTALGAAYLAGLHAGVYQGLDSVARQWRRGRRHTPRLAAAQREKLQAGWRRAIGALTW